MARSRATSSRLIAIIGSPIAARHTLDDAQFLRRSPRTLIYRRPSKKSPRVAFPIILEGWDSTTTY
jgi:hypothetical protein